MDFKNCRRFQTLFCSYFLLLLGHWLWIIIFGHHETQCIKWLIQSHFSFTLSCSLHWTLKCNFDQCWTWTSNLFTWSQFSYTLSYPVTPRLSFLAYLFIFLFVALCFNMSSKLWLDSNHRPQDSKSRNLYVELSAGSYFWFVFVFFPQAPNE